MNRREVIEAIFCTVTIAAVPLNFRENDSFIELIGNKGNVVARSQPFPSSTFDPVRQALRNQEPFELLLRMDHENTSGEPLGIDTARWANLPDDMASFMPKEYPVNVNLWYEDTLHLIVPIKVEVKS